MGQRINIQYSVDIERLPREVGRLLEGVFNDYQLLQGDCVNDGKITLLSYKMAEKIDKIRLSLAAIDHGLQDASNIIVGYLEHKARQNAPDDGLLEQMESMDELSEKIEKFKSVVAPPEKNEVAD
jgi:hypothetical protein|tara:strand:- start:683 stop:1057 length:375 start_codon:yes stop_codon:yes gene_type:complete